MTTITRTTPFYFGGFDFIPFIFPTGYYFVDVQGGSGTGMQVLVSASVSGRARGFEVVSVHGLTQVSSQGFWSQTEDLNNAQFPHAGGTTGAGQSLVIKAAVRDNNGTFELYSLDISAPGLYFQVGDQVRIQKTGDPSVYAIIEITEVEKGGVNIASQRSENGSGYYDGDELYVDAADLKAEGATHVIGGNLRWTFQADTDSTDLGDTGYIETVTLSSEYRGLPYPAGTYEVALTGGTGTGAVIDFVAREGGRILETEDVRIPFTQNNNPPIEPVLFNAEGGSGKNAQITIGRNECTQVTAENFVTACAYFNTGLFADAVLTGTTGYRTGDIIEVPAEDIIAYENADFEVPVGSESLRLRVTKVTGANNFVSVADRGQGYTVGDVLTGTVEGLHVEVTVAETASGSIVDVVPNLTGSNPSESGDFYTALPKLGAGFNGNSVFVGTPSRSNSDGLLGLKTVRVTRSVTDSTTADAPDTARSPVATTETLTSSARLRTNAITGPAKELIAQEQFPVTLLGEDGGSFSTQREAYLDYLARFYKGDYYGLSISESLTPEICDGWEINSPFRYADRHDDRIMALRMDATSWSVSVDGAVMTTNAIWVGDSNGSLSVPANLRGNNQPDTSLIPSDSRIVVTGETGVVSGDYVQDVNIHIYTESQNLWEIRKVVNPGTETAYDDYRQDIGNNQTLVVYMRGSVYTAGSTIELTQSGNPPLSFNGSVVTVGATAVIDDILTP